MISLGFKPAEAEIEAASPDDAVLGQHKPGFRDVQGEADRHTGRKMLILSTMQMISGHPYSLSVQKFRCLFPWGSLQPQESLHYGTYHSLQ